MADADDTQHRLDAAWEAAKEEYKANNNMTTSSSLLGDDGCSPTSPLTASLDYDASAPPQLNGSIITPYYEDPFLLPPSNETSPTSLASSSSTTTGQQHYHSVSDQMQQMSSPTSLLQRYRTFLQKHEPLLSLVEMIMERFVFYGHLFKASSHHHDYDDLDDGEGGIIRTEMYYATWNVIRWINDVVLVGVGGGMGMTVGTREEWLHQPLCNSLSNNNNSNKDKNNKLWLSMHQWITSKLEILIPIIRATLTATTCIYPAIEAFSRRSNNNTNRMGNDNGGGEIISRRYRAVLVSYRLERVRFMGRLALLVISWWAKLQRKRQQQQQQHLSQKGESNTFVPSLLQRGGELDPYERMVPLQDAEDEARVVQYVGRRTGRRSVSNAGTTIISTTPQQQQGLSAVALTNALPFIITKATNVIGYISNVLSSSGGNKLVYVYAVGEILHILRPLYWSRAECEEWQRRRILLLSRQQQQQQQRGGLLSNSWSIWKAWWVSLLMDLISDKLLRLTSGGGCDAATAAAMNNLRGGRKGSTFMGRRGGKQSAQNHQSYSSSSPSSAEEAKLAELEWRRSRHGLYLLRSPMYDVVTRPLASFIARVVSMIPSMGLGRWAAEYVLDMMSYWNSNHFMLES